MLYKRLTDSAYHFSTHVMLATLSLISFASVGLGDIKLINLSVPDDPTPFSEQFFSFDDLNGLPVDGSLIEIEMGIVGDHGFVLEFLDTASLTGLGFDLKVFFSGGDLNPPFGAGSGYPPGYDPLSTNVASWLDYEGSAILTGLSYFADPADDQVSLFASAGSLGIERDNLTFQKMRFKARLPNAPGAKITGAGVNVFSGNPSAALLRIAPAPIPEPCSVALFTLCLASIIAPTRW